METEELLARWHVLLNEPGKAVAARSVLQERLDILHRLNELGTRSIEVPSIFTAMVFCKGLVSVSIRLS